MPYHLPTPILSLVSFYPRVRVVNFQPQRSCSSSQVQGQPLHTVPSYIPLAPPRSPGYLPTHLVGQHTKEVGADEIGHAGRQESEACRKTKVRTLGHAPFTLKHLVSYKTVKSPCYLQERKPLCSVGWRFLCKPRDDTVGSLTSAILRSSALCSFDTLNECPAPT